MPLRTQLIILVLLPICCALAALGGAAYTTRITSLADQGLSQLTPLTNELNDFVLFLQEPPAGSGKPAQYHLQAARNRISSLTVGLKATSPVPTPEERRLIDTLNAVPERLSKQLDQSVRGSSILSSRGAALLTDEIKGVFPVIDQTNSLYTGIRHAATQRINQLNLMLLLIAAAWPVLFALLLYRTLARPLSLVRDGLAAVSRGELSCRLPTGTPGEFGRLIAGFNKMVESRQKSENTLKESEGRLKDVFENLQLATVSLDLTGTVGYCNDYLLQLTGRKRHEVIGKNWFDLFIPEPEQLRQLFGQMVGRGEMIYHHQHEILTGSGERLMIAWSNTLNRDSNGDITGTTSIGTDVTARHAAEQELEQSRRTVRTLVDALPEALILVDRETRILAANSTFVRRLNKGMHQVTGSRLEDLFSAEVARERRTQIEQVFSSGRPLVFSDKRDLWRFEHHLGPVSRIDGSVEAVAMLSIDVTDRERQSDETSKAAEQLRSSNQQLEQQLAQHAAELARARSIAEEASRSKNEFLANMSHEIRTPMNAIMGLVHLALQTELTHKQREYLETVSKSSQTLLGIINDILDVSRIEAGKLTIEKTDFSLEGVLARSVALLSLKAREKGITLEQQVDPAIPDSLVGDPLRLEQILVNLLGNAVKFTEQGSINLSVKAGQSQNLKDRLVLEVCVSDTGIGMDDSTLARLFKPFSQGDSSSTRNHGGTGLGLTICRHLVEMMEGTITVESTPGKGSRFCFSVVLGIGSPAARTGKKAERGVLIQRFHCLKGLHLLVAEDHPINRQIVREVLEAVGAEVETANNGREAVAFMQEYGDSIDLILMDLQMPVMDGYVATAEIRRRFSRNRLPIIAMTAHALNEERERCIASGMNEHLPKPIVVEKLYELLARLTDRQPEVSFSDLFTGEQSDFPQEPFPEQLPGISVHDALRRVNGNTRLLGQLIRLFVKEHQGTASEIRGLIADQDPASAARLVHGLKGVAGNLSAERLHSAAVNLESALKNQDAATATALLPLLESALTEIFSAVDLLAEPTASELETADGSPAEIRTLLSELQHLLELHSLEVTTPINRLHRLIPPGDERTQLEALADAAQRLDYQHALMILHSLAEKTGSNEETP